MMRKVCWASLLFGLCFPLSAIAMQNPAKPATQAEKKDLLAAFHWLEPSGEIHGMILGAGQLPTLGSAVQNRTYPDVEFEVTRPDANSVRTTRRVYDRDTSGARVLVEIVVDDVRSTGAEAVSATRTVSQRDMNGNMQVAIRQTQETVAAGPGSYRTRTTSMAPGINGGFSPYEEIVQIEKKTGDNVFEVERTEQESSANGGWMPGNRHVSTTRVENGRALTEANVYRRDANNKLVLSQKEVSREWTDPQGKVVREREVSLPNAAGRFELNERFAIVRETYADGSQQTTQDRFQISPADPSGGLKLVATTVQTDSPSGPNTNERITVVQTPDANGKLQTISYIKSVVKKH